MQKRSVIIVAAGLLIGIIVGLWYWYSIYTMYSYIKMTGIAEQSQSQKSDDKLVTSQTLATEDENPCANTAISGQLWAKLQKKLSNTVVQLFVTKSEHNILQPYRVPTPSQCSGSGFIISDDGQIVTNAHVVMNATTIFAQMPAFGKHQFEVDLVGVTPEEDLALVQFKPEDCELIIQKLGHMPMLTLGDSDKVVRSEEILALGYPLGQQGLKSTTGVISGREGSMIQMSAPINPGSSGGPSLNCLGQVIGINAAGVIAAQNVGYIIPVHTLKIFLPLLRQGGLVRKPYMGVHQTITTPELARILNNPNDGGTYVFDVMKDSPLYDIIKPGDMITSCDGVPVDRYGELTVPWCEDKINITEYVNRYPCDHPITVEYIRNGTVLSVTKTFARTRLSPVRQLFPHYEQLQYENFAGFVLMPLCLNHVPHLINSNSSLAKYSEERYHAEPVLVITHVMPDSLAFKSRLPLLGSIVIKINGHTVKTLDDVVSALVDCRKDVITLETDDHVLLALDLRKAIQDEPRLARMWGYKITPGMQAVIDTFSVQK